MTTKTEYKKACKTIRHYIREQLTAQANEEWKDSKATRDEYEQEGETFKDYLIVYIEGALEDECPAGFNVDEDIYCGM